jgi:hypothetical protein
VGFPRSQNVVIHQEWTHHRPAHSFSLASHGRQCSLSTAGNSSSKPHLCWPDQISTATTRLRRRRKTSRSIQGLRTRTSQTLPFRGPQPDQGGNQAVISRRSNCLRCPLIQAVKTSQRCVSSPSLKAVIYLNISTLASTRCISESLLQSTSRASILLTFTHLLPNC